MIKSALFDVYKNITGSPRSGAYKIVDILHLWILELPRHSDNDSSSLQSGAQVAYLIHNLPAIAGTTDKDNSAIAPISLCLYEEIHF